MSGHLPQAEATSLIPISDLTQLEETQFSFLAKLTQFKWREQETVTGRSVALLSHETIVFDSTSHAGEVQANETKGSISFNGAARN